MMEDAGVQVRWFRPLRRLQPVQVNHRTHRKVVIVDEAIGFTGGVGIADEWQGDARDERGVARHPLPRPRTGGRRAARGVPGQLGRDR